MGAKYHGEALVGSALEEKEDAQKQRDENERPRHARVYERYIKEKDISLDAICAGITDDLIFQYANKVGWRGEFDAFDNKVPELHMAEKRKIARDIAEARMSNALYDMSILDGMSPFMAGLKYKRYDKKYFDELEKKFWS